VKDFTKFVVSRIVKKNPCYHRKAVDAVAAIKEEIYIMPFAPKYPMRCDDRFSSRSRGVYLAID
jgi:hypothetical protein